MKPLSAAKRLRRCVLTAICLSAMPSVWSAETPAPATSMRPPAARPMKEKQVASPAAVRNTEAPGFKIERVPAWVQPVTVDASAQIAPASVQLLLVDRQTRVERASTVRFVHSVRQITDSSGLQKGAQIEIEFDPSYETLSLHQLAVWRGTQRIDKLDRKLVKLLHREPQLERQVVDGRMTASIVLDDLRVGDRVEWSASRTGDNPVFAGRFVDNEWSKSDLGPVAQWQLRLSAPIERNIRYRVGDTSIQVESQVVNGRRESVFRGRNLAQFRYDPLLPTGEYLKDQIEFSEFADWAEVASWAEQLFDKAAKPSPATEALVADIRAKASTPDAQLEAALDFVQREVRYFGTEGGADSHQPASADTVLRQRFGDCKDKVALLVTLTRQLGFQTTPVLVSTRYGGQTRERLPSPLDFDHAIASVTMEGKTLWLDGTRSQQTGAPATRQPVGLGYALLARSGTGAPQELPPAQGVLRSEAVDTFSFPALAKEGSLESVTTYYGDTAEWIRYAQANSPAADLEKLLVGDMLRAYPTLALEGPPQIEPVAGSNALRVVLRYRTGDFWKFPQQRLLTGDWIMLNLVGPLRLPDQTPRTQPLRLGMPGRYLHTLKFEFGDPVYVQGGSSSRFDEANAYFDLHVKYTGQSKGQTIEGELNQSAERIEAADWQRYRDQFNKVTPRLANTISVPVIAPDAIEALKDDLKALDTKMRRGEIRVVTPDQAKARSRRLVLEKQIEGGRLPPKLRGEALVALGMQFDHLGLSAQAKTAFDEAVSLDGSSAEAHAALAVNALLRRADSAAIEQADAALQLSPSDVGSRYTRAWARYFAGDYAKSQAELQEVLQSRGEVERSYGGIWLYLSARRAGADGAAALRPYMPTGSKPAWPYAVLQWFSGAADFDTALAATREDGRDNLGRQCELYFFAAQKALLDNDIPQARTWLRKSVGTGVVEFSEYSMAQREIDRLASR